jgi:ligand-binding sensor domain-containing protein/signal transduction histidine kinase/DNA-binding response OmpR family regulator
MLEQLHKSHKYSANLFALAMDLKPCLVSLYHHITQTELMRNPKSWMLLFLLLVFSISLSAQLSFDHISVSQGLSQSTVLSIAKDGRGYLWFGTRDGINRYDGRTVKTYRHNKQNSRSISADDYIYVIAKQKDGNLWIGTQNGLNFYQPEFDVFEQIYHQDKDPQSIAGNAVLSICEASNGQIWFGTNTGLSLLGNSSSRKFKNFYVKDGLAGNEIYAVFEDSKKNIWIGTTTGLSRMKSLGNGKYQFQNFYANGQLGPVGNSIKTIVEDQLGNIWIGTERNGISIYHPQNNGFSHIQQSANGLSNNFIRKIVATRDGLLWIGTMNGLNIFDPKTNKFTVYRHDSERRKSLSDNSIKDVFEDDQGSVWIGTNFGGINVAHQNAVPFEVYKYSKYRNSISNDIISVIAGADEHQLLIGTEGSGLDILNTKTGLFQNFKHQPNNTASISSNTVKSIYKDDRGQIWVGLYEGGLELFDPKSGTFKHFKPSLTDTTTVSHGYISCITQDQQGRLWIGTSSKGLNLYDYQKRSFKRINSASKGLKINSDYIRTMLGDSKGNLWVGTAVGLSLLKKNAHQFFRFYQKDGLKSDYINCVLEDRFQQIWIGSHRGGLSKYLPKQQKFLTFTAKNGLASDNVVGLAQDDEGNIWISTDKGLSKFDIKQNNFKNYYVSDGLPANEFSYNAAYKAADGNLYFGSYNGLVSFKSNAIATNKKAPTIVFTALRLFNKEVTVGGADELLQKDISFISSLTFSADQNIFTIDFAALNYIKPERNKYAYKLEGFEDNWNYVSVPSATYTNLPPGTYHLLVKGSNNDGYWNSTPSKLEIKILPPLWKTWWAYLIYTAIFIAILYYINRFLRRQERLETQLYYEHLNYEQQQELYQNKLDFFTRISHEIRTPLTLIFAPLEKLIDLTQNNAALNTQLQSIKNNTDRLLRLIKELLDFRKIETGNLKVSAQEVDIVQFCKSIYEAFESQATMKQIAFNFKHPETQVSAFIDPSQMEKVLFNLLSNAFKYTPEHGHIDLVLEDQPHEIFIKVHDDGVGIAPEYLSEIFTNFYQIKTQSQQLTGWGIGLGLVKSIVDMHKGQITVKSKQASEHRKGYSEFCVSLQKGNAHFSAEELVSSSEVTSLQMSGWNTDEQVTADTYQSIIQTAQQHHILVVEDNDELRAFMVQSLAQHYAVTGCVNGLEALNYATEHIPDLIVSDVTMPVMDGNEFCRKIKSEERTNHIPVLMLTAMASHGNQVQGLEAGADVYLTKPFSLQVLELQVKNLLAAKELLRAKYHKQLLLTPSKLEGESPEEKFIAKLMQLMEQHMEDTDFNVTTLVDEIGMSQTVLYKKVKALTGLSISDFMKSVRLKRAAQLLEEGHLNITEVAYAVGFNDRKYFSKEFKKQFGVAPSDYVERQN